MLGILSPQLVRHMGVFCFAVSETKSGRLETIFQSLGSDPFSIGRKESTIKLRSQRSSGYLT